MGPRLINFEMKDDYFKSKLYLILTVPLFSTLTKTVPFICVNNALAMSFYEFMILHIFKDPNRYFLK